MEQQFRFFFFFLLVLPVAAKYNASSILLDADATRNDSVTRAITSMYSTTGKLAYVDCFLLNDGILFQGMTMDGEIVCSVSRQQVGGKGAQYGQLAGLRMLRNGSWDVGNISTDRTMFLAPTFQNVASSYAGSQLAWMSKHQPLQMPSFGFHHFSNKVPKKVCIVEIKSCGPWFTIAHVLTAAMGKMFRSNRDNPVADIAELTIGMLDAEREIASNFALMGSISLCVLSYSNDALPELRVLYGFRFASYGGIAKLFLFDLQGHTRSMMITTAASSFQSAVLTFSDTENTVMIRLIDDTIEVGALQHLADYGKLAYIDYAGSMQEAIEQGIHAIFLLISNINHCIMGTAWRNKPSPLAFPSMWVIWQDVWQSIWAVYMRHYYSGLEVVYQGEASQIGAWNLHMQTMKTKYWDSFCEWVRGHTSMHTNFLSGVIWQKFISWGSPCADKLFCWHPFRPGPCVEFALNDEHFGNKMLSGANFDEVSTYFESMNVGPLETDGIVSFEISRVSLARALGTGSPTTTSIVRSMKYGMVATGIATNMNFYNEANANQKYDSPRCDVKVMQLMQDVCDMFLTGLLHVRLIKNIMHIDAQTLHTTLVSFDAAPPSCGKVKPPDDHKICESGHGYDEIYGDCFPCLPGDYSQGGKRSTCLPCSAGMFSGQNFSTCEACAAGSYAKRKSPACSKCPIGTFNGVRQAAECIDCLAGHFAVNPGSWYCDACPSGKFQPATRASDCMLCKKNSKTQSTGTVSIKQCDCIQNFHDVGGHCDFCYNEFPFETVICEGGPSAIACLQPGYMTWGNPIQFFFCAQCFGRENNVQPNATSEKQCPPHSGGAGCSKCDVNWFWRTSLDKCEQCENFKFSIGFCVSYAIFAIFLGIRICPIESCFGAKTLAQAIMLANISGPIFCWVEFYQVVFLFFMVDIPWPEYILQHIGIVSEYFVLNAFDLECQFTDKMKFTMGYMAFVNVLPGCVAIFLLIISTPSILNSKLYAFHFPSPILASNVFCKIINVCSITIIFLGAIPMRSVVQPSIGSHGATTMWRFPFILLQTERAKHLRLASILLLIFWSMVLVVMSATLLYVVPMTPNWITLRRCTMSLTIKYKIQYSLFIVLDSAVKIILTCSVIVFSGQPTWQLLSATFAFIVLFFFHATCMPHRFALHSIMDLFKNICSILMVFMSFPIMRSTNDESKIFVLAPVFVTLNFLLVECVCIYQTVMLGMKNIGVCLKQQNVMMESWKRSCHGSSKTTLTCCMPDSRALQSMAFIIRMGEQIPIATHVEILFQIMSKQNMLMWELMQDYIKNAKKLEKMEEDFLQENIDLKTYTLNYRTFLRRPVS
mmetsp:Transcript_17352/g.30118  ORF Transcript_17352/g.30118 Transcript_17352/m.30118 type:complete len:1330 (+) Transcript_17352:71-4060(+)